MVLGYIACGLHKNKKTAGFEINIKNLLNLISLKKEETEKQVLENIREKELVQFLGLKDKNGKVIHFGDILIDSQNNLLTPVCEIENGEHVLFFKPIQHLDKKIGIGCKSTYSNTLEVLGNIYTESELLKGLKEKGKISTIIFSAKNNINRKRSVHIEFNKRLYS